MTVDKTATNRLRDRLRALRSREVEYATVNRATPLDATALDQRQANGYRLVGFAASATAFHYIFCRGTVPGNIP